MKFNIAEVINSKNHSSDGSMHIDVCVAEIKPCQASTVLQLLSAEIPLQQYGVRIFFRVIGREIYALDLTIICLYAIPA